MILRISSGEKNHEKGLGVEGGWDCFSGEKRWLSRGPGVMCVCGEHSHFQVGRLFHVTSGGHGTSPPIFSGCLPCMGHYTVCVPWVILYPAKGIGTFITSLLSRNKGSERFSKLPSITVLGFTTGMNISFFSPCCLHGKEHFPALR